MAKVRCCSQRCVFSRAFVAGPDDECLAADPELDINVPDTLDEWYSFVDRVNRSLNSCDLEFRTTVDEVNGVKVYALVRVVSCLREQ